MNYNCMIRWPSFHCVLQRLAYHALMITDARVIISHNATAAVVSINKHTIALLTILAKVNRDEILRQGISASV